MVAMASSIKRTPKRQKMADPPAVLQQMQKREDYEGIYHLQQEQALSHLQTANKQTAGLAWPFESSFTFAAPKIPNHITKNDYVHDLTKYIPIGCVRCWKNVLSAASQNLWKSCESWGSLAHPRDVYNPNAGPFIPNILQEELLNSAVAAYKNLHMAGWIRMEFRSQKCLGQVRVYVLPDDVGRAAIDRDNIPLRKSMNKLLAKLDIAPLTWNGLWTEDHPVLYTWSPLSRNASDDEASLFNLFNTLPSPKPTPEVVANDHASEAMKNLLASDVLGLKTKLHNYQGRTAALMLQREAQPAIVLDPRLRHVIDQSGGTWYYDESAGLCLKTPRTYETAQGGICAETMGLGKTLICLSLILATRDIPSHIPAEHSLGTIPVRKKTGTLKEMVASAVGRASVPWKNFFATEESDGYEWSECIKALREAPGHYFLPPPAPRRSTRNQINTAPRKIWLTCATLVVVPSNLIQQWVQEIQKHTVGLKVLIVRNGKEKLPPAKEMAEYDIILFSKPRFDRESKDGLDSQGRGMASINKICNCPYIGSSRKRKCTCVKEGDVYRSPLKDLHFKRLITDEGHNFGNASKNQKTEAMVVLDGLQLDARWIISGTPTQGLYGAEADSSKSNTSLTPSSTLEKVANRSGAVFDDSAAREMELLIHQQERKDLEKLGNIATTYLKARPWAASGDDNDNASWAQHVMQPRHGLKSRGSMACLRATLESMIIRHRPTDIEQDVILPPLKHRIVYLEGSIQDKISLNMFTTLITANAVTSERRDMDYFFNRGNKDALKNLFSNMREASFFWSSKDITEAEATLKISQKFLEDFLPVIPLEDRDLLERSIKAHQVLISNNIAKAATSYHEMPIFVKNQLSEDVRSVMSLDRTTKNPTLMGATMIHVAQKFVDQQLHLEDPLEGLIEASLQVRDRISVAQQKISSSPSKKRKNISSVLGKAASSGPGPKKQKSSDSSEISGKITIESTAEGKDGASNTPEEEPKKVTRNSKIARESGKKRLSHTKIVSTASAKLTYLMDQISLHHTAEKILIFYESDNTAFYIAQALECISVKHLIYAKSLNAQRRAQYVVTFNQSELFRVLLMDVSQAAFGLDMSSASRVYFVNPVFNPQVEAQAVKRAHRIGQTKSVFVETLVLKGSIEEVMMRRRAEMSSEQHTKCKNLLDDEVMYDWVRDVDASRFFDIKDVPEPEQMAKLKVPQTVFGTGVVDVKHSDEGLIGVSRRQPGLLKKPKGFKRFLEEVTDDESEDGVEDGVGEHDEGDGTDAEYEKYQKDKPKDDCMTREEWARLKGEERNQNALQGGWGDLRDLGDLGTMVDHVAGRFGNSSPSNFVDLTKR